MASMSDEALEIIWREGGKAHVRRVAGLMKISTVYARTILYSLGRQDYLDIGCDEICILTEKGKNSLDKRGILRKAKEETGLNVRIKKLLGVKETIFKKGIFGKMAEVFRQSRTAHYFLFWR